MNIFTRKKIHSCNWEKLPATEKIIEQVGKLAGDERRPIMGDGCPLFKWAPGIEINGSMSNDEEEHIIVSEEIPIQHEENFLNYIIEKLMKKDDINEK